MGLRSNKFTAFVITMIFVLFLSSCTKEHVVIYDSNGGTSIEQANVVGGNSILEPNQPIKQGYTFLGWYSDSTLNIQYDFTE